MIVLIFNYSPDSDAHAWIASAAQSDGLWTVLPATRSPELVLNQYQDRGNVFLRIKSFLAKIFKEEPVYAQVPPPPPMGTPEFNQWLEDIQENFDPGPEPPDGPATDPETESGCEEQSSDPSCGDGEDSDSKDNNDEDPPEPDSTPPTTMEIERAYCPYNITREFHNAISNAMSDMTGIPIPGWAPDEIGGGPAQGLFPPLDENDPMQSDVGFCIYMMWEW